MLEEEKLVEEYRLAQEYTLSLNDHTWQVATILLVASLGAFALVSSFEKIDKLSLFATLGAATISISLLAVWYMIMNRHTLFIQIAYFRMREIEVELGLWKNLYIHYIDNVCELDAANITDAEKEHILEIRTKLFGSKIPQPRSRTLLKILIFTIVGLWFLWILLQILVIWFGLSIA